MAKVNRDPLTDRPRVVRVVTLPVWQVTDPEGARVIDTFRAAWRLSTDLANWLQVELCGRDVRMEPGMATLPRYDRARVFGTVPRRFARRERVRVNDDGTETVTPARQVGESQTSSAYDLFNRECPFRAAFDGCSVSARDVLKAVEDAWVHHKSFGRFAVLCRGIARPMVFRFPYPWPVPSQNLRVMRDAEDRPAASIVLPGGRVVVRLGSGANYRRELARFDDLLADPKRIKQAKVTGRFSNGRLVGADLRLVGSFDAADNNGGFSGRVFTGPFGLLTAVNDGGDSDPFVYHGDELPGVIARHDDWSHRFAVDMKHEKRWPAHVRRRRFDGPRVQAKRDRVRNRLRTARQTAASQVVAWLVRQGVSSVEYTDADKSFLPRFDWTGLRECLRCKCEENGISFQHQREVEDGE